jgi:hypothetical protein
LEIFYEKEAKMIEDNWYNFSCKSTSKKPQIATNNKQLFYFYDNIDKKQINIDEQFFKKTQTWIDKRNKIININVKLDRTLNGKQIVCEDENSIGRSIEKETLNILCKLHLLFNQIITLNINFYSENLKIRQSLHDYRLLLFS